MTRRLATALMSALLALGGAGVATAEGSTTVDTLDVSVTGGTVRVDGTATFVDEQAELANDPGTGTVVDVTTATAARAFPGSAGIQVAWNLDVPTTDLPLAFIWPIAVDGEDHGYYLIASRFGGFLVKQSTDDPLDPTVANIGGTLTADRVQWNLTTVAMERIEASGGSVISEGSAAGGPAVRIGTAFLALEDAALDTVSVDDYVIPEATVRLGIAPAGTPESDIDLAVAASLDPASGTFDGTLSAQNEPGDYVVLAEACYVPDVCGRATAEVTI